jgi:hypothetical protein
MGDMSSGNKTVNPYESPRGVAESNEFRGVEANTVFGRGRFPFFMGARIEWLVIMVLFGFYCFVTLFLNLL